MIQKLLDWFNNWKYQIMTSNDSQFKEEIKRLNNELKRKEKEVQNLELQYEALLNTHDNDQDTIAKLKSEIKELRQGLKQLMKLKDNKHSSLETYKKWLDENIKPTVKYYDYGKGRKRPHTIFAESIKDKDLIIDFIKNDLKFDWTKFKTADDLVYQFNYTLSKKYPTIKYYAHDKTLYGKIEYWATAKETIEKLRKGKKAYDCDDSMTLRYSCLYWMLKDKFPDDLWRLRGFIVDIWTGGGHAMLAWVKEGVNDWVPVETTFYDTRNWIIWKKNYRIRDQMLYQIRYSFDYQHEYSKI